jgi:hypothetical protein
MQFFEKYVSKNYGLQKHDHIFGKYQDRNKSISAAKLAGYTARFYKVWLTFPCQSMK